MEVHEKRKLLEAIDILIKRTAQADENKTRASYNHAKYLNDRRKMMQDWADMVDGW